MSSRRKCEKRHIGFLTSIYREGISQTVCSFTLQILRLELLHCIPRKTRHVCGGCCDALPASEMGQTRSFADIGSMSGSPEGGHCWTPTEVRQHSRRVRGRRIDQSKPARQPRRKEARLA